MAALETAELPADAIEVGRILDAWGVKGWFKIQPYSAQPEALFSSKRWFVQTKPAGPAPAQPAGQVQLLPIREAREHSEFIVACSAEVPDRQAAEALKGARVFVPRGSFPTAAPDEYYWVDLIGLDVFNREGIHLGQVSDLLPTGPHSVLVIAYESDGKSAERMVPFVAVYVDTVDLPARRITVDWQPDY